MDLCMNPLPLHMLRNDDNQDTIHSFSQYLSGTYCVQGIMEKAVIDQIDW